MITIIPYHRHFSVIITNCVIVPAASRGHLIFLDHSTATLTGSRSVPLPSTGRIFPSTHQTLTLSSAGGRRGVPVSFNARAHTSHVRDTFLEGHVMMLIL